MKTGMVIAVICFFVGSALHTLAQVDLLARTTNNNQPASRKLIFMLRWPTILIRDCWAFAFFTLWLEGQLVAILTKMSVPLPAFAKGILDLHVGGPIAFLAGYLADSALGYIPKLNTQLPPAIISSNDPTPPAPPAAPAQ